MNILSVIKKNPLIRAADAGKEFESAVNSPSDVIFLIKSEIYSLKKIVSYAQTHGKKIFVHLDLCDGLGSGEAAVSFIADFIKPDGVISTKLATVRAATERGLSSVYRVFLIDSQGVCTAKNTVRKCDCDFIEIMPGIIYKEIKEFALLKKNLIAGGLIETREEAIAALQAGALAVSSSKTISL